MRVIRLAALIATAQVALVVILFSFGYSIAHAATLYSQPAIGTSYDSAATGHYIRVAPATNGTNWYQNTFYTMTGNEKYLQIYRLSGNSCDQIRASNSSSGIVLMSTAGGGSSTFSAATAIGNVCQYTIGNVSVGEHIGNISVTAQNSGGGTDVVLGGDPSNGNGYFNAATAFVATGGFAFQLCDIGGCTTSFAPPVPPVPSSGLAFNTLLPETGTTTPTTSVEFKAQYYVASTTIEAQAGHGGFGLSSTKYYLNLTRLDVASTSQYFVGNGAGNDQWNTLDTTITLTASSTWRGVWTSYDASSPYPTYQHSFYFNFSVQSNTILSSLGIAGYEQIPSLSSASTTAIAPAPCNITNLSGCFQNALVFLFYPSTASLDQFSNLWTTIKNKPPFGYVVAVQNAVSTLSASSTATFNLGTVPFMSAIFDPFRTAVAVLMWLVFIVAFYHRLSTLDI